VTVMRTALVVEIEGLLFDTRTVRTDALQEALAQEGATIGADAVASAHDAVPVAIALERLAPLLTLDATGRELVVHRAAEHAGRIFSIHAPSFDATVRDALEVLAAEFPLAVVTRASAEQAQTWLERIGLDASVLTIRSLAALDPVEYVASWADTLRRTHASRGVAIAPPALLRSAQRAGFRTVQLGPDPDLTESGYHPDARLESLSQVHADFLASLH